MYPSFNVAHWDVRTQGSHTPDPSHLDLEHHSLHSLKQEKPSTNSRNAAITAQPLVCVLVHLCCVEHSEWSFSFRLDRWDTGGGEGQRHRLLHLQSRERGGLKEVGDPLLRGR